MEVTRQLLQALIATPASFQRTEASNVIIGYSRHVVRTAFTYPGFLGAAKESPY